MYDPLSLDHVIDKAAAMAAFNRRTLFILIANVQVAFLYQSEEHLQETLKLFDGLIAGEQLVVAPPLHIPLVDGSQH
jgi:hypothetical protein